MSLLPFLFSLSFTFVYNLFVFQIHILHQSAKENQNWKHISTLMETETNKHCIIKMNRLQGELSRKHVK